MKSLMIPLFIFLVGVLGFMVHKETQSRKQIEVNQLLQEADQPQKNK